MYLIEISQLKKCILNIDLFSVTFSCIPPTTYIPIPTMNVERTSKPTFGKGLVGTL